MTAPKLPTPGVRDIATTGKGEGAGAGAGAGRGGVGPLPQVHQLQQRQNNARNGNVRAVGAGEEQQGRCSNSSRVVGEGQARLGLSIMQPLPLASRSADASAAKHDVLRHTPATALGSSWIRRFLPPTVELEQETEATRLPTKAVLGGGGGGGGDSGSQPSGPLLLASAPNELKEQQVEAGGMASKGRMGLESFRETSVKVAKNGESIHKGKAPVEQESWRQDTAAGSRGVEDNVVRGCSLRVNSNPSLHPGTQSFVLEESSKQQQQQQQGNHRIVLSSRGESHVNGTSGAVVTGFGPWVVVKAASKVVGGSFTNPKGTEAKNRVDADVPSVVASDRAKHVSLQAIPCQTGTKVTPKPGVLEDRWSGRPRAAEFGSAWGFPRSSKKPEEDLDGGRPPTAQADGARETVGVSGLQGAESAARFNPLRQGNHQHRLDSMHHKAVDQEGGVDKMKPGSSKFSERLVPTYLHSKDVGQGTEGRLYGHAAEEASARPSSGAVFSPGTENRKMKEIMGSSRRHTDTGAAEQQHYQEFRPYSSPFQGDMFVGKVRHPLPFSPHSSFPGEDNSGEDTRNSRARLDRPKSPLTTVFGAPKPYEDGLDGRAAQAEQQAPFTSLFAAFEGRKQPEPVNSSSQTPSLPVDVRSRLQDEPSPANRPFEGLTVSGEQDNPSEPNDANISTSREARSRFDNQSSHFSSSPWPDEDIYVPNDEAGSRPTGSGYHSQASRVANRSEGDSKGKHTSAYRYDTGGSREVFATPERSRESSGGSEPDPRKHPRTHGKDQGQHKPNRDNQAHLSRKPVEDFIRQAMSGHKDDTSNSSPPSYPAGYNSSETALPVVPRGIVDEHLLSIAGKLRKVEFDSELDGSRVFRIQKGSKKEMTVFAAKRPTEYLNSSKRDNDALYRVHEDVSALLSRDRDSQRAQPTTRDVDREGIRNGKLLMSGEAMGGRGFSGPSKRTRHQGDGGSNFGSESAGPGAPSSWLKRWLPPSSGNAARPPTGFSRPKENSRNGITAEPPRTTGNTNVIGFSNDRNTEAQRAGAERGKGIDNGNATKSRNSVRDIAATRGHNGLPSHPVPSAAAMALVGIVSSKIGPFSQQLRGSVAKWPPVHLQTVQAPEAQQSASSDPSR